MKRIARVLFAGLGVMLAKFSPFAEDAWSSHDPAAALEYVRSLPSGAGQAAVLETILRDWNADWNSAPVGIPAPTVSLLPVLDRPDVLWHFQAPESIRDSAGFLASPADLDRLFDEITGLNSLPARYADRELFPALRLEFVVQYAQIQSVPEPSSGLLLIGGLGLLAGYACWPRGGALIGRQGLRCA